jgi:hypothetical protein
VRRYNDEIRRLDRPVDWINVFDDDDDGDDDDTKGASMRSAATGLVAVAAAAAAAAAVEEEGLDDDDVFELERELKRRKVRGDGEDVLILWKGYPRSEATWEPAGNLLGGTDNRNIATTSSPRPSGACGSITGGCLNCRAQKTPQWRKGPEVGLYIHVDSP